MRIFQSLNCSLCSSPFSSSRNDPKTPRKVYPCGKLMCNECFEREKSLTGKKRVKRLHRCSNKCGCSFKNPHPVEYIIDILNSGSLTLSSDKTGYVLAKPYKIPECVLCGVVYSIGGGPHSPYDLYCNYLVCNGCAKQRRLHCDKGLSCLFCGESKTGAASLENQFNEFLRELPSMTVQGNEKKRKFEQISSPKIPEGSGRKILTHIDSNLYGRDCAQIVRATCLCQSHGAHSNYGYVTAQAVDATFVRETINESMSYHKDVFQMAQVLVNLYTAQLHKRLLKRVDGLMVLNSAHKAQEQQERVRQLVKEFEQLSNECLPHLDAFLEKLQALVEESGQE